MKSDWEEEAAAALRQLRRNYKRTAETLTVTQEDLKRAEAWEDSYHEAILLQSHLYKHTKGENYLEVVDWKDGDNKKIGIEPRIPIEDQLKKRFKAAKKLEKAIPHLQKRLGMLNEKAELQQQEIVNLEAVDSEDLWLQIKHRYPSLAQAKPKVKKKDAPKLPYKKYTSADGTEIWVGRTARDNETLSLKIARGNDWWLHTADVPGSHIVIRSDAPSHETLDDAMQLALYHSRLAKAGEGEVIVTQAKFVSKGPGGHKPGTVSVSKHKRCRVFADPAHIERLRKSILLP